MICSYAASYNLLHVRYLRVEVARFAIYSSDIAASRGGGRGWAKGAAARSGVFRNPPWERTNLKRAPLYLAWLLEVTGDWLLPRQPPGSLLFGLHQLLTCLRCSY